MRYLFHAIVSQTMRQACNAGLIVLLSGLLVAADGTAVSAQEAYRLNTGDRVSMKVVAWDRIELDFREYDALSGEYVIGPDGAVMFPMLGAVPAVGKGAAELADEISSSLQSRLGLVAKPSTTISIVSYRPVYLLGAVEQPGFYSYSPGLTVQQALALAGGTSTLLDAQTDGLSAVIRSSGTLRSVSIQLARMRVTAARLRAEKAGESEIALPDDLVHPDGPSAIEAIVAHETTLLQSRRDAQRRALDAIEDSKKILETEITALDTKREGQLRQIALLEEQIANLQSLVESGLARSPTLAALQRQFIDLENRQLDTDTAVFRAQQSISELARDRISIEANRQLEVLRELQRAEAEVDQLDVRRDTNTQLLAGAEAMLASEGEVSPLVRLTYTITRETEAGRTKIAADLGTRLQPADVLEVSILTGSDNG